MDSSGLHRVALAVDGASMFHAQQKIGWFFDPRRLLSHFDEQPATTMVAAFWYASIREPQDQRPFRDALTSIGFTVRTKLVREYTDENDQRHFSGANLEVEICLDLLSVAGRSDEVVLLSGSRHLERLLESLRSRGLRLTLVHTEGMVARDLRNAADRFIDLNDLRHGIEKVETLHASAFSRG
ncbi:MAG: NYN domain-containing protein [Aphanocapsa feldmannii 277cV]|uniref:NYN domain-containing protein n=1 Tax=Aphanocapsa feldmannii 277cV TaxID=2507553 RepID=A0A524RPF2_9CHRO|nr:MAG: NYN domain-containing protein [Aphanocapsa feldmannii 288cV]TGG93693.1 MAG: NYN domain-containing protein [Aphanocapsa feldmannii 277cV]